MPNNQFGVTSSICRYSQEKLAPWETDFGVVELDSTKVPKLVTSDKAIEIHQEL